MVSMLTLSAEASKETLNIRKMPFTMMKMAVKNGKKTRHGILKIATEASSMMAIAMAIFLATTITRTKATTKMTVIPNAPAVKVNVSQGRAIKHLSM